MEREPLGATNRAGATRLCHGWGLTVALVTSALVLYIGYILRLDGATGPSPLPWWSVALAFAATEAFTVDFDLEQQPFVFSLSSLPLMVALAYLSPGELGLVILAGAGGLIVGDRGKPAPRVVANVASLLFYSSLAVCSYRLVLGDAGPIEPGGWRAAAAVAVTQFVVSNMLAEAGIALESGRFRLHYTRVTFVGSCIIEVLATIAGLLLVVVLWHQPGAVWIPLLLVAALIGALRLVTRVSRRAAKLELLSEFMAQRSLDSQELMTSLLARVRELLHCRVAEIVVVSGGSQDVAFRLVLDQRGQASATTPSAAELAQTLAGRARVQNESIIVTRHADEQELLDLLPDDAAMGAVAVPLRGEQGVLGAIVAADRENTKVFDDRDREVLETVASHAGAVIENSLLLERLRSEAAAMEHEATHDALTGCANRTLFRKRLEEALLWASEKEGSLVGVLLIDLDHFKRLNDGEGHHAGDAFLIETSARLNAAAPPGATVGRLGGDEFAIVLPRMGRADAVTKLAARLTEEVSAPVHLEHTTASIRPSIGEATYPVHATSPSHVDNASLLLRHADQAMYRAKGRRSGGVYEEDEAALSSGH